MSILVLQSSWWGRESGLLLLNLSCWCLVVVGRLFLAVPWGCPRFVIVVFPDHTHLLFFSFPYITSVSGVFHARIQKVLSDGVQH